MSYNRLMRPPLTPPSLPKTAPRMARAVPGPPVPTTTPHWNRYQQALPLATALGRQQQLQLRAHFAQLKALQALQRALTAARMAIALLLHRLRGKPLTRSTCSIQTLQPSPAARVRFNSHRCAARATPVSIRFYIIKTHGFFFQLPLQSTHRPVCL